MSTATVLELVGMGLLALAAWVLHPAAGLIVSGVALLIIGVGIDRSTK